MSNLNKIDPVKVPESNPYDGPELDQFLESAAYDEFWVKEGDLFSASPVYLALVDLWCSTQDYYDAFDVEFVKWLDNQKGN